jgi:hypothetical protein
LGLKPGHDGLHVIVNFLFRILAFWYAKNPIAVFFSLEVPGRTRGDYMVGWKISGYDLHRCLAGRMADGNNLFGLLIILSLTIAKCVAWNFRVKNQF